MATQSTKEDAGQVMHPLPQGYRRDHEGTQRTPKIAKIPKFARVAQEPSEASAQRLKSEAFSRYTQSTEGLCVQRGRRPQAEGGAEGPLGSSHKFSQVLASLKSLTSGLKSLASGLKSLASLKSRA